MKRTSWKFTFVALLCLGLSPASDAAMTKLSVAYSTFSAAQAPAWIAKDRRLFEKYGLDVELLFIRSSSIGVPALMSGAVPIAVMGGSAAVRANLAGSDTVLAGSLKKTPSLTYLVAHKKLTRIEDLRGKTIGVGRFGGSTDFVTRLALRRLGLDPEKDVKLRQIGNTPDRTAALQSGGIDATVLNPEEKYLAEKFGVNILYDLRKLGLEFLNSDIVTTRSFIKKDEETYRSVMKALVEAIHFLRTEKKKSMESMVKYMRSEDPKVVEVGYDFIADASERVPYPSVKGIQLALEEIAMEIPAARGADAARFYDDRMLQQLDKSGFVSGLYK